MNKSDGSLLEVEVKAAGVDINQDVRMKIARLAQLAVRMQEILEEDPVLQFINELADHLIMFKHRRVLRNEIYASSELWVVLKESPPSLEMLENGSADDQHQANCCAVGGGIMRLLMCSNEEHLNRMVSPNERDISVIQKIPLSWISVAASVNASLVKKIKQVNLELFDSVASGDKKKWPTLPLPDALDLSGKQLADDGLSSLVTAWSAFISSNMGRHAGKANFLFCFLKEINLSGAQITNNGLQKLVTLLADYPNHLETLNLSRNTFLNKKKSRFFGTSRHSGVRWLFESAKANWIFRSVQVDLRAIELSNNTVNTIDSFLRNTQHDIKVPLLIASDLLFTYSYRQKLINAIADFQHRDPRWIYSEEIVWVMSELTALYHGDLQLRSSISQSSEYEEKKSLSLADEEKELSPLATARNHAALKSILGRATVVKKLKTADKRSLGEGAMGACLDFLTEHGVEFSEFSVAQAKRVGRALKSSPENMMSCLSAIIDEIRLSSAQARELNAANEQRRGPPDRHAYENDFITAVSKRQLHIVQNKPDPVGHFVDIVIDEILKQDNVGDQALEEKESQPQTLAMFSKNTISQGGASSLEARTQKLFERLLKVRILFSDFYCFKEALDDLGDELNRLNNLPTENKFKKLKIAYMVFALRIGWYRTRIVFDAPESAETPRDYQEGLCFSEELRWFVLTLDKIRRALIHLIYGRSDLPTIIDKLLLVVCDYPLDHPKVQACYKNFTQAYNEQGCNDDPVFLSTLPHCRYTKDFFERVHGTMHHLLPSVFPYQYSRETLNLNFKSVIASTEASYGGTLLHQYDGAAKSRMILFYLRAFVSVGGMLAAFMHIIGAVETINDAEPVGELLAEGGHGFEVINKVHEGSHLAHQGTQIAQKQAHTTFRDNLLLYFSRADGEQRISAIAHYWTTVYQGILTILEPESKEALLHLMARFGLFAFGEGFSSDLVPVDASPRELAETLLNILIFFDEDTSVGQSLLGLNVLLNPTLNTLYGEEVKAMTLLRGAGLLCQDQRGQWICFRIIEEQYRQTEQGDLEMIARTQSTSVNIPDRLATPLEVYMLNRMLELAQENQYPGTKSPFTSTQGKTTFFYKPVLDNSKDRVAGPFKPVRVSQMSANPETRALQETTRGWEQTVTDQADTIITLQKEVEDTKEKAAKAEQKAAEAEQKAAEAEQKAAKNKEVDYCIIASMNEVRVELNMPLITLEGLMAQRRALANANAAGADADGENIDPPENIQAEAVGESEPEPLDVSDQEETIEEDVNEVARFGMGHT